MKDKIEELEKICDAKDNPEVQDIFKSIIGSLTNKVDKYIGDYPTFIEPVYLGENVKIGDDVLLGPNVYIGSNSVISDYVEISNSIILDNVIVGENFTLENCIVCSNSQFEFSHLKINNSILKGKATSEKDIKISKFIS
jgi:NDP-sugar pyrophosphorylase family protein